LGEAGAAIVPHAVQRVVRNADVARQQDKVYCQPDPDKPKCKGHLCVCQLSRVKHGKDDKQKVIPKDAEWELVVAEAKDPAKYDADSCYLCFCAKA
jgi:hypothetical protein